MRRRRLLFGVGALALLGVGFALLTWLSTPTPGVTWENFRHLRRGMSVGDVEAVLGEPNQAFKTASNGTRRDWWDEWDQDIKIHLYFNARSRQTGEWRSRSPKGRLEPWQD